MIRITCDICGADTENCLKFKRKGEPLKTIANFCDECEKVLGEIIAETANKRMKQMYGEHAGAKIIDGKKK